MTTGVVALSFAKRSELEEPGPVNKLLGRATSAVTDELNAGGEDTISVIQWEIAKQLDKDGEEYNLIVRPEDASVKPGGRTYLDSADVLGIAFEVFRHYGVTDVVVVANKFIHLQAARRSVRSAGFRVMKSKLPWVGFDPSSKNLQWWTKGPVRFVAYLAIQVVGKLTRRSLNGIGERTASQQ